MLIYCWVQRNQSLLVADSTLSASLMALGEDGCRQHEHVLVVGELVPEWQAEMKSLMQAIYTRARYYLIKKGQLWRHRPSTAQHVRRHDRKATARSGYEVTRREQRTREKKAMRHEKDVAARQYKALQRMSIQSRRTTSGSIHHNQLI